MTTWKHKTQAVNARSFASWIPRVCQFSARQACDSAVFSSGQIFKNTSNKTFSMSQASNHMFFPGPGDAVIVRNEGWHAARLHE